MKQPADNRWARQTLVLAGIYNLLWGAWVVLAPASLFQWLGMQLPRYLFIWQCVGMIVGVYGVGYLIAARNPFRHWPIVLVGLLGKIFGPIGFVSSALQGLVPWTMGLTIITNDLIWWVPFAAILYCASKYSADCFDADQSLPFDEAIDKSFSQRGATLHQLSEKRSTLVVFLRHSGCTFCREMMTDLGEQRARLDALDVELAVVHMSPPLEAAQLAIQYRLEGAHLFSDPACVLYEAFGLSRGTLKQLFGPRVWWRGLYAGVIQGHGLGAMKGDGFRMPGAFVMRNGEIVAACRAQSAADRVDFVSLCRSAVPTNRSTSTPSQPAGI